MTGATAAVTAATFSAAGMAIFIGMSLVLGLGPEQLALPALCTAVVIAGVSAWLAVQVTGTGR